MFKLNFLKMRTSMALKKNKNPRASVPYKKALSVGIIFSVVDRQKHDDVKEFIRILEHDGKKVKVLEFLPEKKENYEFLFDFFTIEEVTFWGRIKSIRANQFVAIPFDYLFYIDLEPNPLVLSLMAETKALCRVGKFTPTESDYFELMIEHKGTTHSLIENMYKYTKQLR